MSLKSKNNMVWIDLEMTGLDLEKEGIIEMAAIVTDSNLNTIAEGPNLVIHQRKSLLKKMDEWNQKQHQQSGLLEEVKKSEITVKRAEEAALEFIKEYCLPKKSPLCGNAIHHDRRFIIKYMPKLNEYLHYRHVDVSTIKDLVQRWYPKDKAFPKKEDVHRALPDILASIQELKFYREHYFK